MKFTREQRINNTGAAMVQQLNEIAKEFRKQLTDGLDFQECDGYSALKATREELEKVLGDNAKKIKIVCDFILDGKSNKITKGK